MTIVRIVENCETSFMDDLRGIGEVKDSKIICLVFLAFVEFSVIKFGLCFCDGF